MGNSYTVEKMTNALACLATHPGDARKRVTSAYHCIHTLDETDFPPECQKDWNWVLAELTKCGPLRSHSGEIIRGAVENTMLNRRNKTASEIAMKIYELYWQISKNVNYD
jgi:hypothetical protein